MPINQKELAKLVKFCRKSGVNRIKTADFEIELSSHPVSRKYKPSQEENTEEATQSWESLSEEQKLFWSSTPIGASNA